MNPNVRRRLPPSVRSLLTDIGPKEEWTDPEPDPETRDGILLPSRGAAAAGQEELLTPARTGDEEGTDDGTTPRLRPICGMCECKPSCYTCPRCNLAYCGVECYRSPNHSVCSEEFYKESVLQELKEMGKTESEGRQKMHNILLSLREKAERTDGGMEGLLREAGVVEGEAEERVQVVELLSRLAELQQSEDGDATEIEYILGKLKEIGGGGQDGDEDVGNLDEEAVSAEGELDLAGRLSGLDIDKLSEAELWELLDGQEKGKFMALMNGGALGGLVPLWRPWWEEHEEGGRGLVEMLEEEVSKMESRDPENPSKTDEDQTSPGKVQDKGRNKADRSKGGSLRVPVISAKIPKLSSLCADPSPLVCYSLVNTLFGYSFTLRLFNGCTDSLTFEFCDMILSLSETLSSTRVFNSVQEALDCGESAIVSGGHMDKEDPHAPARALEATAHIVTGRSRKDPTGYCLAALSQLRSALSQARAALRKEGEEGEKRRRCFMASKKCEFFQAWVSDSGRSLMNRVAVELWHEHSKRDRERHMMEKAKGEVEGSWKRGKRKDKSKMIEELD
ncbi:zinc finger HIT domain-containing protein 2 [Genypterus blacodes]|uniref:zinc finger HIT domain-containing protein 2 n=1 Tax=Genypterus blacodes TaxID=154954 RepID=UPI003F767D13